MTRNSFAAVVLYSVVLLPFSGTAQVTGPSLSISGNGTIGGTLDVGGDAGIGGSLDVRGTTLTLGTRDVTSSLFLVDSYLTGVNPKISHQDNLANISAAGLEKAAIWRWGVAGGSDIYNNAMLLEVWANNSAALTVNADIFAGSVYTTGIYVYGDPVATHTDMENRLLDLQHNINFNNGANRSITVAQSTTGAGKDLSIQAGNASGRSNQAGGNLILSAGNSRGAAASTIELRTAATGSAGAAINQAQTRLKIEATGGIAAGESLQAFETPQLVIGKYNDTNPNDGGINHTAGLFIVGAGSINARSNALRVRADGVILIKPAPGINPGIFTAGEKP